MSNTLSPVLGGSLDLDHLSPKSLGRVSGRTSRGEYGPEAWADDVLESVPANPELALGHSLGGLESVPANPELALGHSLGGLVLAVAVERMRPARAVYEDPAWRARPERQAQAAQDFMAQKTWGRDQIAAAYPRWSADDIDAKLAALRCFDPEAAPSLPTGRAWDYTPARPVVPSLVQLADPSDLVPPDDAQRLRHAGFEVRVAAGAGHSIHRDDYEGFVASLDGWL